MRRAREANGLSVEEVAAELNLPLAVLDALERGDHEPLPPPAFVRGYLRSFGRLLQVPSEQLVAAYEASGVADTDLTSTSAIRAQSNSNDPLVRWATYAILTLMVIMASLWWKTQWESSGESPGEFRTESPDNSEIADAKFTEGQRHETASAETVREALDAPPALELDPVVDDRSVSAPDRLGELDPSTGKVGLAARADSKQPTPNPQVNSQIELDTGVMTAVKVSERAETIEPAVAVTETSSQDQGAARTLETPVEAAPAEPPFTDSPSARPIAEESASVKSEMTDPGAIADTTVSSTLGADQDELVLTTASQSWGEIYDADGRRLLFDMLESPASRRLRGRSPFRVFLGNSPEVRILFNGAPVEQSRFNRRNNTARFVIATDGLSR